MRILVVDDQKRNRQSLGLLLNTLPVGLDIQEAENGKDAVQIVAAWRPDLVVMDARMPEIDGVEATRLIKRGWPEVKILLLSMYPEYEEPGLQAGADAFISKGKPPEVLLDKICELLGRKCQE